jgi:hypothetical protein
MNNTDEFQFNNRSDFIEEQIDLRKKRDDNVYNINDMEYWTNQDVKDFILNVNHEILRELIETEYWMRRALEESELTSIIIPKLGDQITVKDACQLTIVRIGTIKKILKIMKEYVDEKYRSENKSQKNAG